MLDRLFPLDTANACAASGIPRSFFDELVKRDGVPWAPPVSGRTRFWSRADCVCLSILNELSSARAVDMRRSWLSSVPLVTALNPLLRGTAATHWHEWAEVREYLSGACEAAWPKRFEGSYQPIPDVPVVSRTAFPVRRIGEQLDTRVSAMMSREIAETISE